MFRRAMLRRAARLFPGAARISTLAAALLAGPAAVALEETKGEKAALEACDRRLCSILLEKDPKGPDLKCALTKTWARKEIKKTDSEHLSWGFGDARCSVEIHLDRDRLVAAMTRDRATFRAGRHTAKCVVEQDGKLEQVTAVVAPKIEFRKGHAHQVWVRLRHIDGPASITLTAQTAARLADTFGVFHGQMLKSIDRYIARHCPKILRDPKEVAAKQPGAKDKSK